MKLLKKGCEEFTKQFKQEADFNPFERCATIASACNLYWRWSIKNDTDAALIASRRSHSPLRTFFAFYQCCCLLSLTPSRSRKTFDRVLQRSERHNEDFHPDRGLQIDVVLIRMPAPGSGRKKRNVGLRTMDKDSRDKKSIIRIKNRDNLCCARAIVTMRAWCHRNDRHHMARSDWNALRQGMPRQGVYARQLHQAAGVPEGPCGLPELQKFQTYLSTLDPPYQLKVLSRQHPFFLIFRGLDLQDRIDYIQRQPVFSVVPAVCLPIYL